MFPLINRRSALLFIASLTGTNAFHNNAQAFVPPTIVTTTAQIAEPLQTIFSESAIVSPVITGNLDPHGYIPVRSDVRNASAADVFIYNGLNLEAQMQQLIRQLQKTGTVFAMSDFVQDDILTTTYDGNTVLDPHLWMSPPIWSTILSKLWATLQNVVPASTSEAHPNFLRYMQNLDDLHQYAQKTIATIPQHHRLLVTSHDAFGYFGKQYGIGVFAIQGISTQNEVGLRHIEQLADKITSDGIPAVFVETSVNRHYMTSLIESVRRRGGSVALGGTLFSDAMGSSGSYTGTYIGMIDHNVTTITKALGGDAPPRGMLGLLEPS